MKAMKSILIIIDGPMGAGKSTVGKILHQELKGFAKIGLDLVKWFVSDFSRTPEENRVAGKIVLAMCDTYLQNNTSVILENGFRTGELMLPYLELAENLEIRSYVYQIEAPRSVLMERLSLRAKPEAAKTPVSIERITSNIDSYLINKYPSPRRIFDSSQLFPEEIVERILQDMSINP